MCLRWLCNSNCANLIINYYLQIDYKDSLLHEAHNKLNFNYFIQRIILVRKLPTQILGYANFIGLNSIIRYIVKRSPNEFLSPALLYQQFRPECFRYFSICCWMAMSRNNEFTDDSCLWKCWVVDATWIADGNYFNRRYFNVGTNVTIVSLQSY